MSVIISGTNGIQNVLGSASSPAESNTSSSNTGLYFPSSTTLGLSTAGTNALYIDTSQNVGIGTTSPSSKLHAAGTGTTAITVSNSSTGTTGSPQLTQFNFLGFNNESRARLEAIDVSSSTNGSQLRFYTANTSNVLTQQAVIDSSGNVGIGTTGPGAKLEVDQSTGSKAAIWAATNYAGDVAQAPLYVVKTDNNTTTSQIFQKFYISSGGAASGQITANGANAAAFGSTSDKRLKENIVSLPSQLSNILALKPVEFDYIQLEGGGHQIGFIAQDMQEVYSDCVAEREDGMLIISGWSKTEARLVAAIQELKAELDALKGTT